MKYRDFISLLARQSGYDHITVRTVLKALPEVLVQLEGGDKLITPIGIFRAFVRKGGEIRLPGKMHEMVDTKPGITVKLKPGCRLRRLLNINERRKLYKDLDQS